MATIHIADLKMAGSDLILDQESFLQELSADETALTNGGFFFVTLGLAVGSAAFGYMVGQDDRQRAMQRGR